uniref:Uncharacterized protein n=1 Tax=Oryza meridionalis TaxID=40149 RepID=A0A0E0EDY2_9ORYZ
MEQDHAMEGHIMARTKFVFASTFAASTLGYSIAIAYSLSGHAAKMSLIRPKADHVAGTPTNFRAYQGGLLLRPDRLRSMHRFLLLAVLVPLEILVKEWVAFAIATVVVVLFTFILIWGPPKQKDLMHREMRQRVGNGGGDGNNRVQEP